MAAILKEKYDAIVIGTGPGGATVAKGLTDKGKKVLMLDWGSNAPIKGTNAQVLGYLAIPNKSMYFIDSMLALVRAITVGGSSVVYYATAFEPPYGLFDKYGVNIRDEVADIKKEVPIGPLKDELIGPMAGRIAQSARDLGYDWQKLNKFVYQDKCRANCDKCGLGCPYYAKWNARMFVQEATDKGATLLDIAKVNKVIIENRKATGVEFIRKGKKQIAQADTVIVAAGGIGSPILLQKSGIKNAGANFFYDPLMAVFGTLKEINGGNEFPMSMGIHMKDEDYLMTDMTMPWLVYSVFTAEVGRIDKLAAHPHQLTIMVKARDSLGGKISANGFIRKPFTNTERNKLMKGYGRARKILQNAGAKDIFKTWWIASHPGGTCKIKDIVDSNLKTEYDNLYVCDCSVIPEEWGLPPVLSLLGLGKRLAKHLAGAKSDETPIAVETSASAPARP
ncbi:GMC family oxidoreductase [bacterium]|nr:MAG: GMC family oxidoreductase [bacterium]